ncbi:PREDICTED: peptide-N(4)-(N-acetyl-beta-glucosaminyl)asparagine amidase [Nicrophorus vespilloides]|uniref:Peptide-N(4)-(N-acetyl-beta-glucosaminyl)asparagine amidase n=1 Tax=Nicrophorus vespilloides TaxID=110193 RepID=A0ABM1N235_NICVS|nr:PREDICTED: peptide-N(4)-(N-acetyl-beta-glucosaminyl)asparagine amidase [Nicrophorus vespilloides]
MFTHSDVILLLVKNPVDVFDETTRLLVKIADNILKNPENTKVRTLQKSNNTIANKIIKVSGAVDCLKFMGFQENEDTLTLPLTSKLNNLELLRKELIKMKEGGKCSIMDASKPSSSKEIIQPSVIINNGIPTYSASEIRFLDNIKKVNLPLLVPMFTNHFLSRVEQYFHMALYFDNEYLKERAKSYVPYVELQLKAQERFRQIQKLVKSGKMEDPLIDIQDALILELLVWFKNDFFEWVDSPDCEKCDSKTKFSHMSSDPKLLTYTDKVEVHICVNCSHPMLFPRYNDLNILLETRKGRCGEWAKTFTLICRSLGWDARFIVDETDHVWTEVYCHSQNRWMHCDPCENAYDTPLIYENGWQKKVSYVMAYSGEDLQDVTWRYTSNHKAALARRKNCTERELVDAIVQLRQMRQSSLSDSRKKYLKNRLLNELVELMFEKKPTDKDQAGRVSGSLDWKLSRCEIKEAIGYVWKIHPVQIEGNQLILQYSCAKDAYELISNGEVIESVTGWSNGSFLSSGMFRKEEKDWKMVYLCRNESSKEGALSWKLDIEDESLRFQSVKVELGHKLYENGNIDLKVENQVVDLSKSENVNIPGTKSVLISANLSGGRGDVSWQHAQLFRQNETSDDFPMKFVFTFAKV